MVLCCSSCDWLRNHVFFLSHIEKDHYFLKLPILLNYLIVSYSSSGISLRGSRYITILLTNSSNYIFSLPLFIPLFSFLIKFNILPEQCLIDDIHGSASRTLQVSMIPYSLEINFPMLRKYSSFLIKFFYQEESLILLNAFLVAIFDEI